MPNPSWVLTEMKYETISDDRKEVRATSFCAIKFYPNESPGRSKYTKPSTKTKLPERLKGFSQLHP